MPLAEHFVRAPDWRWYILFYFFLAGLSAGLYVLGSMLRFFGRPADAAAARFAFIASFPLLAVCPILLTVDLGQPLKFWHMLIDTGQGGLNFKAYSPMSLGVWALSLYGACCSVSFLEAWLAPGRLGVLGRVVNALGVLLALYVCTYTGVLLSVSNQPVWSDAWPLGGLFLASALSGSAALLLLGRRLRPEMAPSSVRIVEADLYFVVLEAILVAAFVVTVAAAGTLVKLVGGVSIVLWLVVLIGLAVPLLARFRLPGAAALAHGVAGPLLVLAGVLALRAVVIFGAQS